MNAWSFSPEQLEIITKMIDEALDRRLGPAQPLYPDDLKARSASDGEQGITLVPASVRIELAPPKAPPPDTPPFGFFGLRGLFTRRF